MESNKKLPCQLYLAHELSVIIPYKITNRIFTTLYGIMTRTLLTQFSRARYNWDYQGDGTWFLTREKTLNQGNQRSDGTCPNSASSLIKIILITITTRFQSNITMVHWLHTYTTYWDQRHFGACRTPRKVTRSPWVPPTHQHPRLTNKHSDKQWYNHSGYTSSAARWPHHLMTNSPLSWDPVALATSGWACRTRSMSTSWCLCHQHSSNAGVSGILIWYLSWEWREADFSDGYDWCFDCRRHRWRHSRREWELFPWIRFVFSWRRRDRGGVGEEV